MQPGVAQLPEPLTAPWAMDTPEVVRALDTDDAHGLTDEEAARRLSAWGDNRLREPPPRSLLATLLGELKNPLLLLLLGAATVAAFVGHPTDAVAAYFVVGLNLVLGTVLERRADRSLRALSTMLAAQARVVRGGQEQVIDAGTLVPGDLLVLEAGDRVPADGRLLHGPGAEVDESALTGESVPVVKDAGRAPTDALLVERTCLVMSGTLLLRGRLRAIVTATGMNTEVGHIARATTEGVDTETPLSMQLRLLTRRLAMLTGVAVTALFALGMARGQSFGETLLQAAALAVAAIPEGLPTVVTVTLALGMARMAKRRAVVKHLADVETLGSCSVICSDKTGTLTENRMRVAEVRGDEAALAASARACNDAAIGVSNDDGSDDGIGDPTETALLQWALKRSTPPAPRVAEVPFDASRRFMATAHDDGTLHVKGALESVLSMCAGEPQRRAQIEADADALASRGMRVLAVAQGEHSAGADVEDELANLRLVGVIGLMDPLREGAREAVGHCQAAGIQVIMLTGDSPVTALAIARELKLEGEAHTGRELVDVEDEDLPKLIRRTAVFARLEPADKERIVRTLVDAGEVVAVTGDGVNDAPALRRAHIGVALGERGTEVAKDAAQMVLTDDDFATVVAAIEQGRAIWDNLGRFLRFQLATSLGLMTIVITAPLLGLPPVLTALQILWINLIMDGPPAVALGVDPPSPDVMQRPPRPQSARLLDARRLTRSGIAAATMAGGTLWVLATQPPDIAPTVAFTTLIFFQVVNALCVRADGGRLLTRHLFTNAWLWGALAIVVAAHALIVYTAALSSLFRTVPITLGHWGMALAVASSLFVIDAVARRLLKDG